MMSRLGQCVALLAAAICVARPALADVDVLKRQVAQLLGQGKFPETLVLAQQAVSEAEREAGPLATTTATSLKNLGDLYEAMGNYSSALPLYQRALAIREKALGPDHPGTATILNNLAGLYESMGRFVEALPLYQRALAIHEKALGLEHQDTAVTLGNLAYLYSSMGRYAEALPLCQRALTIQEKAMGQDHPDTATSLNNLAALYKSMGRYGEALPLYHRALAIHEKVLGAEHQRTAASLNNLAGLFESMGRYSEALPRYHRALAITEKSLGPDHSDTATRLNSLAHLYNSMGRYDEALSLYQRALAIYKNTLGLEHPDTAVSINNLAALYTSMGRYVEALPLFQQALAIDEKVLGPDHPDTATHLNNLGFLYKLMGRYGEALPLNKRALAIHEKVLEPDHPDIAVPLTNLALLYISMARYGEALPLYQRALAILEKGLGAEHPRTAVGLNNLTELYRSMGRYSEALPLSQRVFVLLEKTLGADHPQTATSLNNLAHLYSLMGRNDEALPRYERALAIREKILGPDHPETAVSLNHLASLYRGVGRYGEALPLVRRALAIDEKTVGLDHSNTAATLNNLALLYQSMERHDEVLPLLRRAMRAVAVTDITDSQRESEAIDELAVISAGLAQVLQQSQAPGSLDEAIFYYKLSVNARQRMRWGTRGLDTATRESFTKLVASPYQALSLLLVQRGRIAEAERVLLLLKESELHEYLRRNGGASAQLQSLSWTPEEEAYRKDLDSVATRWREFEQRRTGIMDGIKDGRLSQSGPEIEALDQQRLQLETQTANIMTDATQRFAQATEKTIKRREQAFDKARTELSSKLAELRARGDGGLRTAGLVLQPSERGLLMIVTTDQGAVPLIREVSEDRLSSLVKSLRDAIQERKDYREPARALYQLLIEPAEKQLDGAEDIQQWAILPFGSLRALPFASLIRQDGSSLIERYAVTMLTADGAGGLDGLETPTRDVWRGVAFGASQANAEFGNVALPGVLRELCGVIREPDSKNCRPAEGVIGGRRYVDNAFTSAALQHWFGANNRGAEVLHIATHFKVEQSQLLLGDGSTLSTREILGWNPKLRQYDLVVLSACDSGVSDGAVESLAGVFRSQGAKTVLATLWPVADVGAMPMMVEFYRQRGETRGMSKAAALRQTQLAMISGRIKDSSGKADFRHPYFWASYVLMGNWL